jgi:hypothetical protein
MRIPLSPKVGEINEAISKNPISKLPWFVKEIYAILNSCKIIMPTFIHNEVRRLSLDV